MSGEITRALDRPTLDLTFNGTTDIATSSRWAPSPIHLAGTATIDATMKGAPTEFVLDARVTAPGVEIGTERGVAIDAIARLTPSAISVSQSTIRPATGGEIHATVEVPFGAQAAWWIEANWRGLDAASAFRLAEVRVLPFGAALTGTARFDRAAGEPFRLEARNSSAPRLAAGTAPLAGDVEFFIAGRRWRANQSHRLGAARVDGTIGGVWNRESASRSTFEGDRHAQHDQHRRDRAPRRALRIERARDCPDRDRTARGHRRDERDFHCPAIRRQGPQRRRLDSVDRHDQPHRGFRRVAAARQRHEHRRGDLADRDG